jgi:demethylmenaquinone methyltransferase/2-methoxy-6-polyprenyl-1,4-benzoquinol methylase
MENKVNFGSKKVDIKAKPKLVSDVFSSVSNKYDLMNDAMSLGLHRLWKEKMYTVSKLQDSEEILDIATGTGDIAIKFLKKRGNIKLTCLDENSEMLQLCKDRLIDNGFIKNIKFINSAIEDAQLDKNNYSLATIAFGFRNFSDHSNALKNIFESITPGGRLVIMEFTTPTNAILKNIFEKYTHLVIPKIGKLLANDYDSYRYLAESIASFFKPLEVSSMLESAGFENVRYEYLPGNIVTIHVGYKC